MAKKKEEIIVDFKTNLQGLVNNLGNVKDSLSGLTKLTSFNTIDKKFDGLVTKVNELFEALNKPITKESEFNSLVGKVNNIRSTINNFSKDLVTLGNNVSSALYDPQIMKNFEESLKRQKKELREVNKIFNKYTSQIRAKNRAIEEYDDDKAFKTIRRRRGIEEKTYTKASTTKYQEKIADAAQKISVKRKAESKVNDAQDSFNKIAEQRSEIESRIAENEEQLRQLDEEAASLKASKKNTSKKKKGYTQEDKNTLDTAQTTIAAAKENISSLENIRKGASGASLEKYNKAIEALQKTISEQEEIIKKIEDSYKQVKEQPDDTEKRLKEVNQERKKTKQRIKYNRDKLPEIEEQYTTAENKLHTSQRKNNQIDSVEKEESFLRNTFKKLDLEVSEEDFADPEKLLQTLRDYFEEITSQIEQEKQNFERRRRAEIAKISPKAKQAHSDVEAQEQRVQDIEDERDQYKENVNIRRAFAVSGVSPEEYSQNLSEQKKDIEDIKKEELKVNTEEKERQKEIDRQNKKYQEQRLTVEKVAKSLQNSLANQLKWTLSLASIRSALKDIGNTIQELDDSFLSIAAVSDYSMSDMWDKYSDYSELANKVGQSTKDTIETSALWIQQGKEFDEAMTLTEHTIRLATISGQSFSTVTQQMTSALQGFKLASDQAETVTDVYSELAAKAAADVDGIANAVAKVGALAYTSGMDLQTTAAMLTEMIETTQEAPCKMKQFFNHEMFHLK